MDKKYVTPEMDITEFETEDVITTSGGYNTNEGQGGIEDWLRIVLKTTAVLKIVRSLIQPFYIFLKLITISMRINDFLCI